MTGSLLRSGKLAEFKAMAEDGQPVFHSAPQLREAVRLQLGRDMANHLAEPQRNEAGDTVDWYSPVEGDVVPWSSATDEERAEALAELTRMQAKLNALGETMRALPQRDRQIFGRLLGKVIHFPDDTHVHLVNGKPVLTFWGFVDPSGPVPDDPLLKLRPKAVAAALPPVAPIAGAAVAAEGGRRLPWWLWLLLLLLLIGLVLWLLRACAPEPEAVVPAVTAPTADPVVPERDLVRRGPDGRVIVDQNGRVVGQTDASGNVVGELVPDGAVEPVVPADGDAPVPPDAAQDAPVPPEAPAENPVPPAEDAAGEQPPAPETETPPGAEPPPEPPAEPPPADAAQPPGAAPPMEIPPDAVKSGNTGFLDGQWNAGAGIQDARTGKPMRLNYDFDKSGDGKVTMQAANGVTCTGKVAASMQGGGLAIKNNGQAQCSDGSTYRLPEVKCAPGASSAADCSGSYDEQQRFPMSIRKGTPP